MAAEPRGNSTDGDAGELIGFRRDEHHIDGAVCARFTEVATTFAENFDQGRELGASVCVYVRGRKVVDLWGGLRRPPGRLPWKRDEVEPWQRDTVTYLASATKAAPAALTLMLADRGEIDLEVPVREYWPEFGQAGKENIPVRWLLNHTSGVVVLSRPFSTRDMLAGTPVAQSIAEAWPAWTPGTAHGYHAITFGFALGEIIRRITGKTIGRFFAEQIGEPHDVDVHIGLPESGIPRVAKVRAPKWRDMRRDMRDPKLADFSHALRDRSSVLYRATFGSTKIGFRAADTAAAYRAEEPSGGAIGNAAGLAKLYAVISGESGGRGLLSERTVEAARQVEASGRDRVLQMDTAFGLGFALPGSAFWPSFGAKAFGYPGATGSLGFADPDTGVAFGYVPNKMTGLIEGSDERADDLVRAVYRCVHQ